MRTRLFSLGTGFSFWLFLCAVFLPAPNATAQERPILSIEATWPRTSEPLPNALVTPGRYTIRRSGDTNAAFRAYIRVTGTANSQTDYRALPSSVEFARGQTAAQFDVFPASDDLVEGDETVIVDLEEPPTMSPMPSPYAIAPDKRRAIVVINDEDTPFTNATVEITRPRDGETFATGSDITITAVAKDPEGYIPRVEFFANDKSIGVSQIFFFRAPDPGTPITHEIVWTNAPAGDHVLTARGTSASGQTVTSRPITIHVGEPVPNSVILSLDVTDSIAIEPGTADVVDDGRVLIKRVGGPNHVAVHAQYTVSGTASNGVDYTKLSGSIELASGQMQAEVRVHALQDSVAEDEETVILHLVPPPCIAIYPPPPECYEVREPVEARILIRNRDTGTNGQPTVRLVRPVNGAVFDERAAIEIVAEASDPDGIRQMRILIDGQSFAISETNRISFRWTNAPAGEHLILAQATDNAGTVGQSSAVRILVRRIEQAAFVFRKLPAGYTPGVALRVELRAEPPATARAYAVEDAPPAGWTVSHISHEGAFDTVTGKVKFGPFTDATARTLTYQLTPPANATGRKEFAGEGSIDGRSYPIGGDRILEQAAPHHPADADKNLKIVLNELTAYAAAWKHGTNVPLSYVTRAGQIWKQGEAYNHDPAAGAPPLCWVPQNSPTAAFAADGATLERTTPRETRPGVRATVQLRITPPTGSTSYAVEERVPIGWTVSEISNEGVFNADTGVIRWGLFLDSNARTLSYALTPPASVSSVGRLSGHVSFNGEVRAILGSERILSFDANSRPILHDFGRNAEGRVHLRLDGPAGQVGVLQRSADLDKWDDVTIVYLPDGSLEFSDDAGAETVQYYRLQIR